MAECELSSVAAERLLLTAGVGGALSLVGAVESLVVLVALLAPSQYGRAELHLLGWLALCDALLCLLYGPLVVVGKLKDHWRSVALMRVWWRHSTHMLMLAQLAKTFSAFVMLQLSAERWLLVTRRRAHRFAKLHRCSIVGASFVLALLLRAPVLAEIQLVPNGNCTGVMQYQIELADFAQSFVYGTVYRYYVRNLVAVFAPFILMTYLNAVIVRRLRQQSRHAALFRFGDSERKAEARRMTKMAVFIVSTYLLTNALNIVINTWEYVDQASLHTRYRHFYAYGSDSVSVLSVLGSCLRAPVYVCFCSSLRRLVVDTLCCRRHGSSAQHHRRPPNHPSATDTLVVLSPRSRSAHRKTTV